ncbi:MULTISPECIES: GtrA family protein [unclassified Caballeronia]|uniref:GtrA family protein n=1 Tax=unclassified Caballeronia TaxID=2646786 RepID=UPI00158AFF09|nr:MULTISPECIES: GtrA family protein [unclassified Caballeronia]QSN60682.1 GtrA family protein [Caballeronia sp. M1242]
MTGRSLKQQRSPGLVVLIREALIAGRFALVGCAATLVHMAIAGTLVGQLRVPALFGNTCAFLCAFVLSFCGHYFWTFSQPGQPKRALLRFLTVSLTTFLINTALLASVLRNTSLSAVAATLGSAVIIPVISLVASRLWCFRDD